jgi:hypothetical protein
LRTLFDKAKNIENHVKNGKKLGILKRATISLYFSVIFDCYLYFIICKLSKVKVSGQLWTEVKQKWMKECRKLVSSKWPNLFVGSSSKTVDIFYLDDDDSFNCLKTE